MASSEKSSSPIAAAAASEEDHANNDLQPFFVIRKAYLARSSSSSSSSSSKSERKPSSSSSSCGPSRKTKRKIDLSSSSSSSLPKSSESDQAAAAADDQLRLQAFQLTWSKIDYSIKDVLRKINLNLFSEVQRWVNDSFSAVKSVRDQHASDIQSPFPILADPISKLMPTSFIFTKNAEFVDDLLTFQELGQHLNSNGCHVTNLSALDFSPKHGIAGCLRSLLRQLVTEPASVDAADITMLTSWYSEPENNSHPMIVIIDDMEQCNSGTLSEFIILLSEWVIKLPFFFIMGVATTVDAPRRLLSSDVLQHLQPIKFALGSPCEKMSMLIENVLVKKHSGFNIGHKVAVFLKNYFLKHDGTITSFTRALKIACIKHFQLEPLSFLGLGMLDENCENFLHEKCQVLTDTMCQYASHLPSCKRAKVSSVTRNDLMEGWSKLRILQNNWSSVVLCLFEVGKLNKMQLVDIFCEAADPSLHNPRTSDQKNLTDDDSIKIECGFTKGGSLAQVIQKVRELSDASLSHLLSKWRIHTEDISEVHDKVRELQSLIGSSNARQSVEESATDIFKRSRSVGVRRGVPSVNDKAAMLLDGMIRTFMIPIESLQFHEIICFKRVDVLQSALVGDPRSTIQLDLIRSQSHLQCSCCSRRENAISPSMHDTSIMYNLAQEYGDLINLHDWYQSFKATIASSFEIKRKVQHSPASKIVKGTPPENEATTQARFCRAVTELQITGLVRMPSKRRPDFVQRVAFGL